MRKLRSIRNTYRHSADLIEPEVSTWEVKISVQDNESKRKPSGHLGGHPGYKVMAIQCPRIITEALRTGSSPDRKAASLAHRWSE